MENPDQLEQEENLPSQTSSKRKYLFIGVIATLVVLIGGGILMLSLVKKSDVIQEGRPSEEVLTEDSLQFVYFKEGDPEALGGNFHGEFLVSDFKGTQKTRINLITSASAFAYGTAESAGRAVYVDDGSLWLIESAAHPRKLTEGSRSIHRLFISSDGTKIAFRDGGIFVMNIDGTDRQLLLSGEEVVEASKRFGVNPFGLAGWSSDKSKLYLEPGAELKATNPLLFSINIATKEIEIVEGIPQLESAQISFSRDANRIAYKVSERQPDFTYRGEIWMFDFSTKETRLLIESKGGVQFSPLSVSVWSPDERKILFGIPDPLTAYENGLATYDIDEKKLSKVVGPSDYAGYGVDEARLGSWAWLSSDKIIYTVQVTSENINRIELYTADLLTGETFKIDEGNLSSSIGFKLIRPIVVLSP